MPQDKFGKIRNSASAVSITANMTFFIASLSRGADQTSGPISNASLNLSKNGSAHADFNLCMISVFPLDIALL